MNMNRSWTPPDNDKILPNLYNVLDAHALRKTSSMNGMLDSHLNTQHNVISRHRYRTERVHRKERARVAHTLRQIQDKLPTVERIKDFNLKFFKNKSLEDSFTKLKKCNTYKTNDEPICRRCYNHHFAVQKHQLTNGFNLPSIPKNRRLPDTFNAGNAGNSTPTRQKQNHSDIETEKQDDINQSATDNSNDTHLPELEVVANVLSDKDESNGRLREFTPPTSPTKQAFGWWMPRNKTFQFLQKDKIGREIDVNKHYTPRLMPYEDWKNVVRDVCAHCSRPERCVASIDRQPRGSIDVTSGKKQMSRSQAPVTMCRQV